MAEYGGQTAEGKAESMVELRGLTKYFGRKKVLDTVNLSVPRGCILGLLGPNGAGKTTLMRILSGVISGGYTGTVRIAGHAPGVYTKSIVSYLPDQPALPPGFRVREAVDFYHDFYPDFDRVKAGELVRRLHIDPAVPFSRLSKGSREKVQLVLTVARRAQLYVLDEPIGGVDPAARDVMLDTILDGYTENATLLIATQIIQDVERIFSRVVFLREGAVILNEDVDALRETYQKSVDSLFREVFACSPN